MAKRKLNRGLPPTERVQVDQVTHEVQRTVLDIAQLAFERTNRAIENAVKAVPTDSPSDMRYHLVHLAGAVLTTLEAGVAVQPTEAVFVRVLLYEWHGLQPSDRGKFSRLLRVWLAEQLPHTESSLAAVRADAA